jgi:hypothetical protein
VFDSRQGQEISLFCITSRSALRPTQPPVRWAPGIISQGLSGKGVKLTAHLQLMPRSRTLESIHPLSHTSSWHSAQLVKYRDIFTIFFLLSSRPFRFYTILLFILHFPLFSSCYNYTSPPLFLFSPPTSVLLIRPPLPFLHLYLLISFSSSLFVPRLLLIHLLLFFLFCFPVSNALLC